MDSLYDCTAGVSKYSTAAGCFTEHRHVRAYDERAPNPELLLVVALVSLL